VGNVTVKEGLMEDHAQTLKLQAFNNTNQLKICEHKKEYEVVSTHLVISDNKRNKVI
jgi:hypothetical protein